MGGAVWRPHFFQCLFSSALNDQRTPVQNQSFRSDRLPSGRPQKYWTVPLRESLEEICSKSSTFFNFAGGMTQKARHLFFSMPPPLSVTRIKAPPSFISTVISSSSCIHSIFYQFLYHRAGRSTTSPAAILSIVFWSKTAIFLTFYHHLFFSLF